MHPRRSGQGIIAPHLLLVRRVGHPPGAVAVLDEARHALSLRLVQSADSTAIEVERTTSRDGMVNVGGQNVTHGSVGAPPLGQPQRGRHPHGIGTTRSHRPATRRRARTPSRHHSWRTDREPPGRCGRPRPWTAAPPRSPAMVGEPGQRVAGWVGAAVDRGVDHRGLAHGENSCRSRPFPIPASPSTSTTAGRPGPRPVHLRRRWTRVGSVLGQLPEGRTGG